VRAYHIASFLAKAILAAWTKLKVHGYYDRFWLKPIIACNYSNGSNWPKTDPVTKGGKRTFAASAKLPMISAKQILEISVHWTLIGGF